MIRIRRLRFALGGAVALAVLGVVGVLGWGALSGYRPVVLSTGSMAPSAPAGSVLVARPVAPERVAVGDIVVMRRGGSLVSHRVIERIDTDGIVLVRTKGDANVTADATPYRLAGDHLVARWIVPGLGRPLAAVGEHRGAWLLAVLAVVVGGVLLLWSPPSQQAPGACPAPARLPRARWVDHRLTGRVPDGSP